MAAFNWNANEYKIDSLTRFADAKIASNDLQIDNGHFVTINAGFIEQATAATCIEWVSQTKNIYATDNQTIGKATVNYYGADLRDTWEVTVEWWVLTNANVGQFANIVVIAWATAQENKHRLDFASLGVSGQLRIEGVSKNWAVAIVSIVQSCALAWL